jgi:hypothetical protein
MRLWLDEAALPMDIMCMKRKDKEKTYTKSKYIALEKTRQDRIKSSMSFLFDLVSIHAFALKTLSSTPSNTLQYSATSKFSASAPNILSGSWPGPNGFPC